MAELSKTYKMKIIPLSPIHIGSGEELNPGDYFIFNDDQNWPVMHAIDMGYFGTKLNQAGRDQLCKMIEADPVRWVAKIVERPDFVRLIHKYTRFRADMTDVVAGEIREMWGKRESRLAIQVLQRSMVGPIIPGSSIKGAIRTALLWSKMRKPFDPKRLEPYTAVDKWERKTMGGASGNIQDDPLRYLRIADSDSPTERTFVVDTYFEGMPSKAEGLRDYRECFPDSDGFSISTRLSILSGYKGYREDNLSLNPDDIIKSCRDFYSLTLKSDTEYWGRKPDCEHVAVACTDIQTKADESPGAGLIRLGWGCGMNGVSLNMAKPDGPQPHRGLNPEFRKDPITRRLLDSMPPGWALFTLEEE